MNRVDHEDDDERTVVLALPAQNADSPLNVRGRRRSPSSRQAASSSSQRQMLVPLEVIEEEKDKSSGENTEEYYEKAEELVEQQTNYDPAATGAGYQQAHRTEDNDVTSSISRGRLRPRSSSSFSIELPQQMIIQDVRSMGGPLSPRRRSQTQRHRIKSSYPGSDLPDHVSSGRYRVDDEDD